ncbi:MAG: M56 family metallopeptidase [Bacteroidales bacterium]|nr:M56 family metallopeptidase [Bacteroidales bacterium]
MAGNIFIYIGKVSLGLAIISLVYLFFRNDSNLRLKRFYLLGGILASWVFPFIRFPRLIRVGTEQAVAVQPSSFNVEQLATTAAAGEPATHFDWMPLVLALYCAGVLFILLRNVSLFHKWKKRRNGGSCDGGNIIFTDGEQIFTLFSWIFIPEKYRNDPGIEPVIRHERAHIRQLHFIDLIIVELTVLLTWFNPFTWLISRMIKENHEHLADREVLAGGINPARYRAQLLNFTLGTEYFNLGHCFNHSLTKTRFKMMKRTTVKKIGIIKYLLVVPVIILALGILTGSEMQDWDGRVKGKIIFADTGEPATGASVIVKGTTNGTTAGREGIFELECDRDDMLVFSFVGYESKELKASWITDEPVTLEFKSYEINLERVKDKEGVRLKSEKTDKVVAGRNTTEEIFIVVEDMPMFPGGLSALKSHIYDNVKYPEKARREGIEGKVTVDFEINAKGDVEDVSVSQSTYAGFDKAAMEVFKDMPRWEPGKQRGHPVKVKLSIPVEFKLGRE